MVSKIKIVKYNKTCVKRPLSKISQIGLEDHISLNAGQRYCRMLQEEHSAILSTFIKLSFVIGIFVLTLLSGRFTQVLLYQQQVDALQLLYSSCSE